LNIASPVLCMPMDGPRMDWLRLIIGGDDDGVYLLP
jgi:hypothetical protein